jgi:MFS family permease
MNTNIPEIRLGLRANRVQFSWLVVVNAFVGAMVGMERTLLPGIAEADFHMAAKTAIFSFIAVFGTVKAFTNYFTGRLSDRFGRKNLLITGWIFGLPVPFLLMFAPDWSWVIAANILLGINQGLAWSSTVIMKIDLVGERDRGFAMGLNEFAGYIAVAVVAWLTGWMAAEWGMRPWPFLTGVFFALAGLFITVFLVKDTRGHVAAETAQSEIPRLQRVFSDTSWRQPNLGAVTQAGLINNLNDGMAWGLFPVWLAGKGFSLAEIGIVTAVYPAVWGIGQLFTGRMADRFCKKDMLQWGMAKQALALLFFVQATSIWHFIMLSALLGWGTAMVYPTFLATIAENTHPGDRAKSIGIFRLWRDAGYAIGALLTGLVADLFGMEASIILIAVLTFISAFIIHHRMYCRNLNGIKFLDLIFKIHQGKRKACS